MGAKFPLTQMFLWEIHQGFFKDCVTYVQPFGEGGKYELDKMRLKDFEMIKRNII